MPASVNTIGKTKNKNRKARQAHLRPGEPIAANAGHCTGHRRPLHCHRAWPHAPRMDDGLVLELIVISMSFCVSELFMLCAILTWSKKFQIVVSS